MYESVTQGIRVSVTPQFLEQESDDDRYFWAYTVVIENEGEKTAQLKTRYWQITDAVGRVEEVRGPGVVGETPVLKPGESFTYTSGCPLREPSGVMVGHYGMVDADGAPFEVEIPAFSLDSPEGRGSVN
jgi:ApaG protein